MGERVDGGEGGKEEKARSGIHKLAFMSSYLALFSSFASDLATEYSISQYKYIIHTKSWF